MHKCVHVILQSLSSCYHQAMACFHGQISSRSCLYLGDKHGPLARQPPEVAVKLPLLFRMDLPDVIVSDDGSQDLINLDSCQMLSRTRRVTHAELERIERG